jgi:hypothetical protein
MDITRINNLLQQAMQSRRQIANASGHGAAGSQATFSLPDAVNGQTSITATCLTNCPPGSGRTVLARADDGTWYAFDSEPSTAQSTSLAQLRRRRQQLPGVGKVAFLLYQLTNYPPTESTRWKIFLAGHQREPVFICEGNLFIPSCPIDPLDPPPLNLPSEGYETDVYYWGGLGVSAIDWGYRAGWYCDQNKRYLIHANTRYDCSLEYLMIPPLSTAEPYFPNPVFGNHFPPDGTFPDGLRIDGFGSIEYVDANNTPVVKRCEYGYGWNANEQYAQYLAGAGLTEEPSTVGFYSWGHLNGQLVVFGRRRQIVTTGAQPEPMTVRVSGFHPDSGVSYDLTISLEPIGHEADAVCHADRNYQYPPGLPQPDRRNDLLCMISGDRNAWYVSVFDMPLCDPPPLDPQNRSDRDSSYGRRRYFRIKGTDVEQQSDPWEGDWRFKSGTCNRALKYSTLHNVVGSRYVVPDMKDFNYLLNGGDEDGIWTGGRNRRKLLVGQLKENPDAENESDKCPVFAPPVSANAELDSEDDEDDIPELEEQERNFRMQSIDVQFYAINPPGRGQFGSIIGVAGVVP